MNLIGKCVVAGNVRRTAEIVFGEPDSEEYLDLKNYEVNPHRATYGWTSNNSIYARIGMDYRESAERVRINGEPGYAWLDNMRKYGRMADAPNWKDKRASGGNPCLEQTLESHELCCLVETFPNNHDSLEDYLTTLQYAYLYAKTVTLGQTHWPETNRVMLRNRRIGCSMSGIAQFIANRGVGSLKEWMDTGYNHIQELDEKYSDWMAIPRSIKTTSPLNHREQFPCLQVQHRESTSPKADTIFAECVLVSIPPSFHLWKKRATKSNLLLVRRKRLLWSKSLLM